MPGSMSMAGVVPWLGRRRHPGTAPYGMHESVESGFALCDGGGAASAGSGAEDRGCDGSG